MKNWEWLIDIFTFIGMAVCIIIALIAIVWVTCFAVKLLIKTFNVRVGKSYELTIENINKKAESKKERNDIKRKAAAEKKMELLNMKLESKQKIHEMKQQKLAEKLANEENKVKNKLFGENVVDLTDSFEPEKEPEVVKVYEEQDGRSEGSTKKRKKSVKEDSKS